MNEIELTITAYPFIEHLTPEQILKCLESIAYELHAAIEAGSDKAVMIMSCVGESE